MTLDGLRPAVANSPDQLTPDWFGRMWRQARNQVGNRYRPDLNVALSQTEYIQAICQDEAIFDKLASLANDLARMLKQTSLKYLQAHARYNATQLKRLHSKFEKSTDELHRLAALRANAPTTIPFADAVKPAVEAERMLRRGMDRMLESRRQSTDREQEEKLRYALNSIGKFHNAISAIVDYLTGPVAMAANAPYLLLLGSGGTGKTHLLSNAVENRVASGKPALLLLGQSFQSPFGDLPGVLTESLDAASTAEELFHRLSDYAVAMRTRCLISIDAVNEGHRPSWKKGLRKLLEIVRRYQGIALVVSCRTPFDKIVAPSPKRLKLQVFYHYGFPPEKQSEAVRKYFTAFRIPIPEVPLLEEELSNPLFLRLFCEAVEKVTTKAKHKQIKDIASGQRGMTHILEFFVDQKDRSIRQALNTPPGVSWMVLKDGIAKAMAEKHVGILRRNEASIIVNAYQPAGMEPGKILQALINEDVLAEDVFFENGAAVEGVRFSYQRFADHLIARHLLGTQLDTSNKTTIKRSLLDPRRLGAYLANDNAILANASLVQALLVEFPVRIHNRGELLDYLGWRTFPFRLCQLFVEGLYWRDPSGINESTGRWIGHFLGHEGLRGDTLNVLVALAVKPRHPFQAKRLDAYLSKTSLVERDLFWSEYLRHFSEAGTPERVLVWMENAPLEKLSHEFVDVYLRTTQWFLTSTMRAIRDRATHCLFRIGVHHPEDLFHQTLQSLRLNDPYVRERMLAASYGVAMALWRTKAAGDFGKRVLPEFARSLFRMMFSRRAPHGTTHVLAREYARRAVELALLVKPSALSASATRLAQPPFRFGGIRRWGQSEDKDRDKYRDGNAPMHMDFENYTLGRLFKNRRNYDFAHREYAKVRRQVFWRIYNLGYTLKVFAKVDSEIANLAWRTELAGREGARIERYGKKYCWIAYYEIAGYRQDQRLLPERSEERISDVDIDPSFPRIPSTPPLFTSDWIDGPQDLVEWMRSGGEPAVEAQLITQKIGDLNGPWVVLDGFVVQTQSDREIFAFLRGVLVPKESLPAAQTIFSSPAYPAGGSRPIPEVESEYYTYAGEIPWADTWHFQQYRASLREENDEVNVLLPVRRYAWESYHSVENKAGSTFPSKELATSLGLYVQIPDVTMAEADSHKVATLYISAGKDNENSQSLLLVRQDLLDRYLGENDFTLILIVSGERQGNYRVVQPETLHGKINWRDAIHKQCFVYDQGHYTRFI